PCRRQSRRRRSRKSERTSLFVEILLPAVRLRDRRARAASVLVQQSDGRVPALRRPGLDRVLRPATHRRAPEREPRERRDPRLGPAQPILLRDAAVALPALP